MPDLSRRSYQAEIMDDLQARGPDLEQALRELHTINKRLGGYRLNAIALSALIGDEHTTFRLVDVGCGRGDTLIHLAQFAASRQFNIELIGIDANPHTIHEARANCMHAPIPIRFEVMDVFSPELKTLEADLFCSSLFMHHFRDEQIIQLLQSFSQHSRIGFFINDLHRHILAYYSIWALTGLFSRSAMVRHDARLSVARSFRRRDWQQLFQKAGLSPPIIRWMWAFRWMLIWKK